MADSSTGSSLTFTVTLLVGITSIQYVMTAEVDYFSKIQRQLIFDQKIETTSGKNQSNSLIMDAIPDKISKLRAMKKVHDVLVQFPKYKKRRTARQLGSSISDILLSAVADVLTTDAPQNDVDAFIQELEDLAAVIDEEEATAAEASSASEAEEPDAELIHSAQDEPTPPTEETNSLWEYLSGLAVVEYFGEASSFVSELVDSSPAIQLLNTATSGSLTNLLRPSKLRQYIRGEADQGEEALMQFVTVVAPRHYEFPPRCKTSSYYTERFTEGSCQRMSDCLLYRGESFGTCGLGTGSCCVYHRSCDAVSSDWISHFTEPLDMEPGPGTGACRYRVQPRHNNVCQYRLDFEDFMIAGPNRDSVCEHDFVEFFGGYPQIPKLCGDLTGQHLYITAGADEYLQLTVYTSALATKHRKWNIKITQINCDSPAIAPQGCLQYFTDTLGTVTSFNFKRRAPGRSSETHQLSGFNYGVCVKTDPDYCALVWEERGDYGFTLSGDSTVEPSKLRSVAGDEACVRDYIIVNSAVYRDPNTSQLKENSKFCGTKLPKLITNSQPYVLRVVTDKTEFGDSGNTGFDLSFKQVQCDD